MNVYLRLFIFCLTCKGLCFTCSAQAGKFDSIANDILLNIWTYHPANESVAIFIKQYLPIMFEKGDWKKLQQSSIFVETDGYIKTSHGLIFVDHPYINSKFKEGKLEFFVREKNNKVFGISDVYLWLEFDSKRDADSAFSELDSKFKTITTAKRIINIEKTRLEFTSEGEINEVTILLLTDSFPFKRYRILYKLGQMTRWENP